MTLFLSISLPSYAGIVLKGVVADNGGVTLPGALLVLQDAGGAVVSSAETDADGAFSIEAEKAGEYHLSASAFLFNTVTRTVSVTGEAEQNVGTIVLEPQETLDAAKVSSERKYVQTKVNGFAYDVASDPDAEKLTARELLLRIPFVKVDPQTQAVQVLGKDVEFTVNGKKSTLLSKDNQAYMTKLITGGKLKSIQLVTQTSGRDADKAAVINLDTQDALGDLIAGQLRVDAGDDAHAGGYAGLTSKNGGNIRGPISMAARRVKTWIILSLRNTASLKSSTGRIRRETTVMWQTCAPAMTSLRRAACLWRRQRTWTMLTTL